MAKNLKKRTIVSLSVAVLALSLGSGCSHHKPASSDQQVDAANVPPPDAGTDAVPQGAVEDRSGDTAGNVPPPPSLDNAGDTTAPPPAPTDASNQPPAPDTAGMPAAAPTANAAPAPADQTAANTPAPDTASTAAPADTSSASTPDTSDTASADGTYTVKAGDTLMKIAFENYGDLYKWKDIYDANKDSIKNPNDIPPGTVLKIQKPDSPVVVERNGDQYLIKSGDTLGTISNDVYGTPGKWKKLWENNKQLIKDPNKIYAGFYLYYTMTPDEKLGYQKRHNGESPSVADSQPSTDQAAPADTDQGSTDGTTDTRNPASVPNQPQAAAPAAARGPASVTPTTNAMNGTTAMTTDALTGGNDAPPPPEMVNVPPPAAHSADLNQVVQNAQQEENAKATATAAGP